LVLFTPDDSTRGTVF